MTGEHLRIDIPDRMRDCDHSWSPAVHRIGLESVPGALFDASRCLRCGLWLVIRPASTVDDSGVCT